MVCRKGLIQQASVVQTPQVPKKGLSLGIVIGWPLGDKFRVLEIFCLLRVFCMPDTLGHVLLV